MDYQGDIIRPPSEANSIILQATTGCSHNLCTFCGAYREKKFRIKTWDIISNDIEFAAKWCRRQKTVFLADGDALALPHEMLMKILSTIKVKLPWIRRVSSYANCQNILKKTPSQLKVYKELNLSRIYLGLESGADSILKKISKGSDSREMIKAGIRVREAGMFLSVTCLLGIGGTENSLVHANATADVLNKMHPHQAAMLTLIILPNTPLYKMVKSGSFKPLTDIDFIKELRGILEGINIKTQFQANHASNYLALSGRLPKDKELMLNMIDDTLSGSIKLKEEFLRGL